MGDSDRAALSESWAQQRSANVRAQLLELVGAGAALSASDLAAALRRRSEARRDVRLQVFDRDESDLETYFAEITLIDVREGSLVVLLGDFGSGKSEVAETWHRAAIRELETREGAPFPLWLSAREIGSQSIEQTIEGKVGPGWRQGRGASIAVDGLDEIDPAMAQVLLESSRVLVKTYPLIRVMLTSRSGILMPTEAERIDVPLLEEDNAMELVQLAAARSINAWQWTADMRSTIRRPFFALAAGVMLATDGTPTGEADLIRGLVEGALHKGTERSVVTSAVTFSALEKLAVSLTRDEGDGLTFAERQIVRSSRLTSDSSNRSVTFSLPILQQWFAAQAVLSGVVPADEVTQSAKGFSNWRWASAVAALSAPTDTALDDLIDTWLRGNPGVGAWILTQAFHGHRQWRSEQEGDLDAGSSGLRLLRAFRIWSDALGPMSVGTLPAAFHEGPVKLGVSVSGQRVNVAIGRVKPESDIVTEVPPGVHPFIQDPSSSWQPWFNGTVPAGRAWPWLMAKKKVAGATLSKLSEDPNFGSADGVWAQERRYDLARRLLGKGTLFHEPLSAASVRAEADRVFQLVNHDTSTHIAFNGTTFSGDELKALLDTVAEEDATFVESYLPTRDESNPVGSWVWNLFTPRRLIEFEVEVYGRACLAFDEALEHALSRFDWSLPSTDLSPFGILMEVRFDRENTFRDVPLMTVWRVPLDTLSECVPPGVEAIWSSCRRAVAFCALVDTPPQEERHEAIYEIVQTWINAHHVEPMGGFGYSQSGTDDMVKVRPASDVAANWIYSDLKSLGLGEGTFPTLR